jgi:hypothetical protein
MQYKYAMLLVDREKFSEDDIEDHHCLVELYQDDDGEWTSFCMATVASPSELEHAYKDVKRDGVNTWFYENGKFTYKVKQAPNGVSVGHWDWERGK